MRSIRPILLSALFALTLVACGERGADAAAGGTVDGVADEALPEPTGTPGQGVTGMPGAREVEANGTEVPEAPEVALDENGNPLPPDAPPAEPGLPPPLPEEGVPAAGEAAARPANGDEAVAVVRDYYGAINGGSFGRAYAMWADGGRASGPSPQHLADDFADTAGVSAEIGMPAAVAPEALQIDVPVTVTETLRDGGQRRLTGSYVLRRTTADAPWRIAASNLREAGP